MMIDIVLGSLALCAILCLLVKSRLAIAITLAAFSLLSALLFFIFDAPDVAIAEAAIGAGASTMIFVWALQKTGGSDEDSSAIDS